MNISVFGSDSELQINFRSTWLGSTFAQLEVAEQWDDQDRSDITIFSVALHDAHEDQSGKLTLMNFHWQKFYIALMPLLNNIGSYRAELANAPSRYSKRAYPQLPLSTPSAPTRVLGKKPISQMRVTFGMSQLKLHSRVHAAHATWLTIPERVCSQWMACEMESEIILLPQILWDKACPSL